ncbi:MAG: hypothetical protein ACOH5I_10715 [Oligoflexus sp.]
MKCPGKNLFIASAFFVMTVFSFQGCGLPDSKDRGQLQVAYLSEPAEFVLECSLHVTKDGQTLYQNQQTSSRFALEAEANRSIPTYQQSLEQACEKSLGNSFGDASAVCRGLAGASRAILCSTKKI